MAKRNLSVKLIDVINEFNLDVFFGPPGFEDILLKDEDVNRPGLQLAGFFEYFSNERIQVLGKIETTFMERFTDSRRYNVFNRLFELSIPAAIFTRSITPCPECIAAAKLNNTPLLRTSRFTAPFISELTSYLKMRMGPRMTIHGTLIEVYGEGVLLMGDSGIGKSETALELVKRGHRIISDDAVEIFKPIDNSVYGTSPEMTRYFMELRGIGIIDVRRIFGVGAVKQSEEISLVIHLDPWQEGKAYERLGLEDHVENILGVDIPTMTIPVAAGRNLAVIIEIATMNSKERRMGTNSAEELSNRLYESLKK